MARTPSVPSRKRAAAKAPAKKRASKETGRKASGKPVLLSGGNPQIAKGYGDEPVQAYIAAMPGWKKAVGERLDAIITKAVPGVRKAVKWNTHLYGSPAEVGTWFAAFHVFEKYIKISFFRGAELKPMPPDSSKMKHVRYLNLREGALDEAQFADWIRQASKLPGEKM